VSNKIKKTQNGGQGAAWAVKATDDDDNVTSLDTYFLQINYNITELKAPQTSLHTTRIF
jgi:hypothetical protein